MQKRKSNAKSQYDNFDRFLNSNPIPIPVEFSQKKFTQMDLINVKPMTTNQQRVFDLWKDDYSLILAGCAGSGKSFLALYLALNEVLDKSNNYEKIIIVRSAVPTRDQGFVKGTNEEKNAVFETPYEQLFNELFKKKNQYKNMKEVGLIEFHTTSYIRGLTFHNAIIIFDEFQSATYHELFTVATRIGKNSKVIFCGDMAQNDLLTNKNDVSGFNKFVTIADRVPSFRKVYFTHDDIVRSGFVKELIIAEEMYNDAERLNKRQ